MTPTSQLRALLRGEDIVIAPGAYDGITGKLIAHAGFDVVYMTGAGTAASLGYPDFGLVTMTEMADNAGRIARASGLPVIADADTGYGNELNAFRTVQEYERRGVAGMHIEDQVFPKKCGHLDDKEVIPREDFIAKIRAAAAAKQDPDFLLIARTDSRAVIGMEEAVARCNEALDAGADMAFLEAPQTLEEVAAVPKLVHGPCMLNVVWGGKTPLVDMPDAQRMGYKLAIFPGLLFKSVIGICDEVLQNLKVTRRHATPGAGLNVRQVFNRFGADEWDARRTQFRTPAAPAAAKPAKAAE
ncbi:MAG TPA: isocitrate lyase/PEP mutase family protein [Rhodopila sp.]|nr:isocitrate lyase/PEP mutase family protein [Rhodopila sp.]